MGMYWIDEKYLLELSGSLELFKRKGANNFNHRCPFCGDSQKDKNKARGYHFEYKGGLVYKCHNCGKSCSTGNFIEELDTELHKKYRMEMFKELRGNRTSIRAPKKKVARTPKQQPKQSLFDKLMDGVKNLPSDHKAVKLLEERMIPKDRWDDIYYLDDMRKIGQLKGKYKEKLKTKEDRLVIAYRGRNGQVVGLACRSFENKSSLRYISIVIDDDAPQVYGYDRLNLKKRVYVLEGAFDAMFIPNSVAVSGSNLKMVERILSKEQAVLVYDCQPRNKEIVKLINKSIKDGYFVSLLPETGYKDINLMIQGEYNYKDVLKLIRENTVRGLKATLKFNSWKKI